MACSRRGGAHTPLDQKRAKDKLAQEVELSLYEDAFSDPEDLDTSGYGD